MAANTKRFVVDASFALAFLLPDEFHLKVDTTFKQFKEGKNDLFSTSLIYFEVINGLKSASIQKRVSSSYCQKRLEEFLNYQINIYPVDFLEVFLLSEKTKLTPYDASYLYLSKTLSAPLLTLDKELKKHA